MTNESFTIFKSDNENFSIGKVIELQWLLSDILEDHEIKLKLVAAVRGLNISSYPSPEQLFCRAAPATCQVFISSYEQNMIFPLFPISFLRVT
jgi:hypothetical protein